MLSLIIIIIIINIIIIIIIIIIIVNLVNIGESRCSSFVSSVRRLLGRRQVVQSNLNFMRMLQSSESVVRFGSRQIGQPGQTAEQPECYKDGCLL